MTETYPNIQNAIKPVHRHCFLELWKGDAVQEPLQFFLIEDEESLSAVINLGYHRKNMQSLYMTENHSYLTTDTPRCDKNILNIYEKAEKLAKVLAKKNDIILSEKYDELTFSFPEHMIDESGNIIKEV